MGHCTGSVVRQARYKMYWHCTVIIRRYGGARYWHGGTAATVLVQRYSATRYWNGGTVDTVLLGRGEVLERRYGRHGTGTAVLQARYWYGGKAGHGIGTEVR